MVQVCSATAKKTSLKFSRNTSKSEGTISSANQCKGTVQKTVNKGRENSTDAFRTAMGEFGVSYGRSNCGDGTMQ